MINENNCVICLTNLNNNCQIRLYNKYHICNRSICDSYNNCLLNCDNITLSLPCGHHFHSLCIREWFARSSSCPLCNYYFQDAIDYELSPYSDYLDKKNIKQAQGIIIIFFLVISILFLFIIITVQNQQ